MTKEEIGKLLNRQLTDNELENFNTLLIMAISNLGAMLGYPISSVENASRKIIAREGFRTVFIPPINNVDSVKINGEIVSNYSLDNVLKYNVNWNNAIVFTRRLARESIVEIDGNWGFKPVPDDLKVIIAQLFDYVSNYSENNTVAPIVSETVLSHKVTYSSSVSALQEIKNKNFDVLNSYYMPYEAGSLR